MLRLVIWPRVMLLGLTETKLWTLKYGSKSIQTSLILRQRPPKLYKLLKIFMISVIVFKMGKHIDFSSQLLSNRSYLTGFYSCHKTDEKLSVYMVLGVPVSKLETFVWILNQISTSITFLVSVYPKSIKLGQMTNLNMIFHEKKHTNCSYKHDNKTHVGKQNYLTLTWRFVCFYIHLQKWPLVIQVATKFKF